MVSSFRHMTQHNTCSGAKSAKRQIPSLKIKIPGFRVGASTSELSTHFASAKPASADAEPEDTQDESDGTQTHPNDNRKQPKTNSKLKRRHASDNESSEDVESKAKKSKKEEAAPKRPRGRPRKNTEVTSNLKARKSREKEFSVVVYVEVAVPPKLHAGKTHKGDKMVLQAPRRCGPFSMFRKTKWSNFLENIAAVTGIDKENLLLPGVTWRMQGKKEQDGLPLQSRDAFKAMRDILKHKARKEQPVLLVHHPIATQPGGEKQSNIEGSTALETTRWSEKVNICCYL